MGLGAGGGFWSDLEQAAFRQRSSRLDSRHAPREVLVSFSAVAAAAAAVSVAGGGREEGPRRTLHWQIPWLFLYLRGLLSPSHLECRGVEGQSLGTPRHAANMPLFATNPFDQDVGKCFHRPRWVSPGTASPRRPPTPCVRSFWIPKAELTFLSHGAPSFRVGRGLSAWRILFERNGT